MLVSLTTSGSSLTSAWVGYGATCVPGPGLRSGLLVDSVDGRGGVSIPVVWAHYDVEGLSYEKLFASELEHCLCFSSDMAL